MALNKKRAAVIINKARVQPNESFYNLWLTANNGKEVSFKGFEGKFVLIVNTASDCGYTGQYEELQRLQNRFAEKLVVIGFPSNNFGEQEKGSDIEIEQFCQLNYGVQFLLSKKTDVVGANQHPVYNWLSSANKNGWNEKDPEWNFSKYLVNRNGLLTHYFSPSVNPLGKAVVSAITFQS